MPSSCLQDFCRGASVFLVEIAPPQPVSGHSTPVLSIIDHHACLPRCLLNMVLGGLGASDHSPPASTTSMSKTSKPRRRARRQLAEAVLFLQPLISVAEAAMQASSSVAVMGASASEAWGPSAASQVSLEKVYLIWSIRPDVSRVTDASTQEKIRGCIVCAHVCVSWCISINGFVLPPFVPRPPADTVAAACYLLSSCCPAAGAASIIGSTYPAACRRRHRRHNHRRHRPRHAPP